MLVSLVLLIISALFFILAGLNIGSPYRLEMWGWACFVLSFGFGG